MTFSDTFSNAIHKARHATGGADAIAPADIGADVAGAAAAAVVTAGTNADTKIADERVTERANQMNTFVTVAEQGRNILRYGVTRGTTASQTIAIKAALDANPGETFYFPPGDYRLDTSLVIAGGNSLVLDRSARIYAGAAMSVLIDYTSPSDAFGDLVLDRGIVGGLFDGNLLAGTVLSIQRVLRFTLSQFTVRDGINRGLKVGPTGAEVLAHDGRIYNTGTTNVADNIAIDNSMGDSYWSDIIILDWTVGVKDIASSSWFHIHPWLSTGAQLTSRYPTSVAFDITSQSDLDSTFADTYRTAYLIRSNGTAYTPPPRFLNARAYWAPTNLTEALALANPACVIDNTAGVGGTFDRTSSGGHPLAPASFLVGPATLLTARDTINYGYTTGVADYLHGAQQGETLFTPTLFGTTTAGTPTYGGREGRMVLAGNTVTYTLNVAATMDATIAGALRIGGLPVPAGVTGVRLVMGSVGYVAGANIAGVYTGGATSGTLNLIPVSRALTGSAEIWANDLQSTAVEIWATIQAICYTDA